MSIVFNLYRNPLNNNRLDGAYPNGDGPAVGGGDVLAMSLSLTTAGRVGFYVDYSELSAIGSHTFYVCRTHGTTGAVTVDYATGGDSHTSVSGTLSWANGEANIKSVTVPVASKSAGDHRVWMLLSNPTGGLVLHNGATHTRAFGVIDDGTIASDSDAVFYDSAATGGTGTQADPYDSIYTAIANVGAKRYIYGKGTTTINTTNTVSIAGSGTINCINTPSTRAGESTRLYIRNWPGSTWSITGSGTSTGGFYTEGGNSYHTYRGLDFSNLNTTAQTLADCFSIFYRYGSSNGINIEHCTTDNIDGATGTNNGAYQLWGVDGYRVWRSTANNIKHAGSTTNENTGGVYTYLGTNGSVQRCHFSLAYHGIYHKRTQSTDVTTSARFNFFDGNSEGVAYRISGGADDGHQYSIVQNNLFKNCTQEGLRHWVDNGGVAAEKQAWSNNVFDTCGTSDQAAVHFRYAYNAGIYNNIMLNCRRVWADYQNGEGVKIPDVEYADYNCEFGTTSTKYAWKGTDYATAALLNTASGFAASDINSNPSFTNTATNDYSLGGGSPCLGAGVSGVDMGIYLVGIEEVGP